MDRVRVLNAAALAELQVEIEPEPGLDGAALGARVRGVYCRRVRSDF
jgi:hypothetical protein